MAEQFKAEVTLLHVVKLFEEDADEEKHLKNYERDVEEKEKLRAAKIKSYMKNSKIIEESIHSALIRGFNAADSILSYVETHKDFDLIIMGTHGHTGFKRWILGSDTERIIRFSPLPVLTIHKEWPQLKLDKIAVPIDFSSHSKTAVKKALQIADEFNAQLVFIHVVEEEAHPEFYNISFESILLANPALKGHILQNLQKLAGLKDDRAEFVVLEGKVSRELKNFCEKEKTDLIVIPARGMSDLEHLFLGSNTEKIARTASCPVLTIRS
jgi:nucleotide-binding universal stress UspA family protein